MSEREYLVQVDRADGQWLAHIAALKARVDADSLTDLKEEVERVIAARGARSSEVRYEYPPQIARLVIGADVARGHATAATNEALDKAAECVRALDELGVSRRDAAELLNLSHQRVQQLITDAKTYPDGHVRRHEDDDGEMEETSRRHGGMIRGSASGPWHHIDHVFGRCKKCGAVGRWTEPSRPARQDGKTTRAPRR